MVHSAVFSQVKENIFTLIRIVRFSDKNNATDEKFMAHFFAPNVSKTCVLRERPTNINVTLTALNDYRQQG